MWKGILITLGIIVGLIIIIKLSTRSKGDSGGNSLENSLSSIRSRFDDVCKKIGLRSGC